MKRYSVAGASFSQAAPTTIISLTGSTTVRPIIYDILVGNTTAVAAQSLLVSLKNSTAAGTGTSVTPRPLLAGDVVAQCTALQILTGEPTYTGASLLDIPLSVQATMRWVAQPEGELVGAASASNGIGMLIASGTATLVENGTIHFRE